VHKRSILIALALASSLGSAAMAASIDASLIPDGTYTVKVESVVDSKHMKVALDNGSETTLAAGRDTVDFTKIKAGDQVKLSLGKGQVLVFLDLTSH
jgi:translation initiation factor IF-1